MWVDLATLPHGVEVVEPASADDAAEVLAKAAEDGRPVALSGSGSRWHWQPPVAPDSLLLSTMGLIGEADIQAENLTVTVPAGVPLFRVRRQLEESGFWLPLIHVDGPDASMGGCLAAGFTNPLRLAYGLPRDWVLGLEVVSPDGRKAWLGGELVRNVGGYDLVKMHLGAWGRLGLITRATLRLLPLPESQVTVEVRAAAASDADEIVRVALHHDSRPCALEIAGRTGNWSILAWLVGNEGRAAERAEALARDLRGQVRAGTEHLGSWSGYALDRNMLEGKAGGRLKISVRPPGLEPLERFMNHRFRPGGWDICGQAGSGVYTVFLARDSIREPIARGAASAALALRQDLEPAGHVTLEGRLAAVSGNDWLSFPPRAPRPQDALEDSLVRALSPRGWLNRQLPLPGCTADLKLGRGG